MPRRNSRVQRSNDRNRISRQISAEQRTISARPDIRRISVEEMVMPDGNCTFQTPRKPKARFATEEKAAAALHQAQIQRARTGSTHVEKRYYKCPEGGCGGYHLSSREAFDERVWKSRRQQHEERMRRDGDS